MTGASAALAVGLSGSGSGSGYTVIVPGSVTGLASGAASSGTVTSTSAAATVSGGTPAYTYLWSYVSGNPGISITTPTASSTTFSATVSDFSSPKEAYFELRVEDNLGVVVISDLMLVSLEWVDTR